MTPKQQKEIQLIANGEPARFRGVRAALVKTEMAIKRGGEYYLTWRGEKRLKEKSPSG